MTWKGDRISRNYPMGKDDFQFFVFGYCIDGCACSKTDNTERVTGFKMGRWGERDDKFSFGFNFEIHVKNLSMKKW